MRFEPGQSSDVSRFEISYSTDSCSSGHRKGIESLLPVRVSTVRPKKNWSPSSLIARPSSPSWTASTASSESVNGSMKLTSILP